MYHIIIADDEKNALDELRYLIDWSNYDITIDAVAGDGEEAILLIEKFNPDMIFCDINMPKKNGMAVLDYINQSKCNTLFIAISAYSDFIYAQNCINNGGFSYLLKTIDKDELLAVIEKAKKITDTKKEQALIENYRNTLFSLMSNNDCLTHLKNLGISSFRPFFTAIKTKLPFAAHIENFKHYSNVFIPFANSTLIIVNHEENIDLEKICIEFIPCGISSKKTNFNQLYYEADCAYVSTDFFNRDVIYYKKSQSDFTKDMLDKILVAQSINEVFDLLNTQFQSINQLCALYNMFLADNTSDLYYFEFLNEFKSLRRFSDFLFNFHETKLYPETTETIEPIHAYITQHYNEELSLQSLCKIFFISPSHLNKLFKKKYGMPVNKFITATRMNKALELIKGNNNLTLLAISQMVGYSDFYYFSRVFKKTFNIAPSLYKNDTL